MFSVRPEPLGRLSVVIFALVLTLAVTSVAVVSAGQAPVPDPVVSAARAIVVDSLTGEVLYGKNQDSRALQGSVAKIMTAHVALWAVNQGYVSLDDPVAISARAQEQGCACLQDANGDFVSDVQVGEVFTLRDLLYGLFLGSAGEATDAIAEYVGGAVFLGTTTTAGSHRRESERRMNLFLELMNDHVAHLGLVNTKFVTVHGGDTCDFSIGCFFLDPALAAAQPEYLEYPWFWAGLSHKFLVDCHVGSSCGGGTTPRDLVTIWNHAVQDHAFFLAAAGSRNRTITSTLGSQTKTYMLGPKWFGYYPGVDGDKNGGSQGCIVCWLAQATRNGRSVVAVVLQAPTGDQAAADMTALFRYGFARIFGPDRRPDSGTLSTIKDVALDCSIGGAVVTASRRTSLSPNTLRLAIWLVNVPAGAFTKLADWPTTFSSVVADVEDVDVALVRPTTVVTALVRGSTVELRSFTVECGFFFSNCSLVPVTTSASLPGLASRVRLVRLSDTLVVSAVQEASGAVRLHSWSVAADGTLALLGSSAAAPAVYEFAIAGGPRSASTLLSSPFQIVTAARTQSDNSLHLYSWSVDQETGTITKLKDSGAPATGATDISIGRPGGRQPVGRRPTRPAGDVTNISIARTGRGRYATAVTTGTTSAGALKVIFWDVSTDGTFTLIGQTDGGLDGATDTAIAPLGPPSHAGTFGPGTFPGPAGVLTASRTIWGGDLELIVWEHPKLVGDSEGATSDFRIADSGNLAGGIKRLDICRIPTTHAADDYVTAVRTNAGRLKLIPWRVGAK